MGVTLTREDLETYAQVDYIIKHMNKRYYEKVPKKLANFFETFKAPNFPVKVNPHVRLDAQGLKKTTLEIIALLHLKYWCEDEERRKQLYKLMENRQLDLQRELEEKANANDLFNPTPTEEEKKKADLQSTVSTAPKKLQTIDVEAERRKAQEEMLEKEKRGEAPKGEDILPTNERKGNIIIEFFKRLIEKGKKVYKNDNK